MQKAVCVTIRDTGYKEMLKDFRCDIFVHKVNTVNYNFIPPASTRDLTFTKDFA